MRRKEELNEYGFVSQNAWNRKKIDPSRIEKFDTHTNRAVGAFVGGFATMPFSPALSLILLAGCVNEIRLANKQIRI
jgi:hypothetical protein